MSKLNGPHKVPRGWIVAVVAVSPRRSILVSVPEEGHGVAITLTKRLPHDVANAAQRKVMRNPDGDVWATIGDENCRDWTHP